MKLKRKMKKIKLLDCTLRDGGYINNWEFGYQTIRNIISKLVETEVDYIEVGFLRNCEYSKNKTLYNNIAELKPILPISVGKTKFVVMALHNLYDISKLEENDGTIEAMRVTFHNYDIDEGLGFVSKAIAKGYKVFCNPINIMGYSDTELLVLIKKVNEVCPYAFSIVDTFGSMMENDLLRIYSLVEHNLEPTIKIGLHLHENLGLSYSLAQNFIKMKAVERDCIIDGSLLGMGRVPGNLNIELMMDYMNRYYASNYSLSPAYDAITNYIEQLKSIEMWGYSTAYALSAKYNLHRNYSEYLLSKGKLRAKDINYILASIVKSKKAAFDKDYIEMLYQKYQNVACDDTKGKEILKEMIRGRNILILAPGSSLVNEEKSIKEFILQNNPFIISANFMTSHYNCDLSFFTNRRRYDKFKDGIMNESLVVSSNLSKDITSCLAFVDYYSLACDGSGLFDNCVIMLIRLLIQLGVKHVNLAGFDGFDKTSSYYAYEIQIKDTIHTEAENNIINNYMDKLASMIDICFITKSKYTSGTKGR